MSSNSYQVGEHVEYYAIGGGSGGNQNSSTTGKIVNVLTESQSAGTQGTTVNASEEDPRFVIKNDNTGKETAYKAENIIGRAGEAQRKGRQQDLEE